MAYELIELEPAKEDEPKMEEEHSEEKPVEPEASEELMADDIPPDFEELAEP